MIINKQPVTKFIVDATASSTQHIDLVAGVDAGSTETRVVLIDSADFRQISENDDAEPLLKVSRIPSALAFVSEDEEVSHKSRELEENYDSIIIPEGESYSNSEYIIKKRRIVRGNVVTNVIGSVTKFMDSSTPKVQNEVFYLNVIDAIGYAILRKYSGNVPTDINVNLGLSVRPNELSKVYKSQLQTNLIRRFIFKWKTLSLQINITGVTLTTEPEAQIEGSEVMYDIMATQLVDSEQLFDDLSSIADKLAVEADHIHIEGGGSSVGCEFIKLDENGNPVLLSSCSSTFNIGGNYLMRILKAKIKAKFGRSSSDVNVLNALITGELVNGSKKDNVIDLVKESKQQLAVTIFEKLQHEVIDTMEDVVIQDIAYISLAGRLFNRGKCGISVADYFKQLVLAASPSTEVIILPENYIPQGNALNILNSKASL